MSAAVVTGWSAVRAAEPATEPLSFVDDPLPPAATRAMLDFDVRAYLGRKGTSFYDRATAMAVVACGQALKDARLVVDDTNRHRIGIVLGTTLGSFKSTSDYTKETLVGDKPYLVNPVLFPNTVMNCAAGQSAIRLGLRGVNSTVASGPLAFVGALRYATNAIERGYVDTMLVGAVEEFSAHRAWASYVERPEVAVGEAATVFVVSTPNRGGTPEAEVLAAVSGYGGDDALDGCVRRALARSGVRATDIDVVYTGEATEDDTSEYEPVTRALGLRPERIRTKATHGECDAATGGLALAALLADHTADRTALVSARSRDGGVAVAIFRRCGSGRGDRG